MRVNTTDLQNAFGKYLALVEKEDIIVTKNGKSVAKLVHYKEPEFAVHEGGLGYKTHKRVSYEEYMELVASSDQRYELIDGEVYVMASPSYRHQVAISEITLHFGNFFRGKPCRSLTSPLDVRLFGFATKFEEDPNVVQPDILVICDQEKVSEDDKYFGVPSLIVEVLSPSSRGKDMIIKLNLYAKSGVREYWVVDLEGQTIMQYSFSEERDVDDFTVHSKEDVIYSTAFEGLKVPLADVFSIFY